MSTRLFHIGYIFVTHEIGNLPTDAISIEPGRYWADNWLDS